MLQHFIFIMRATLYEEDPLRRLIAEIDLQKKDGVHQNQ